MPRLARVASVGDVPEVRRVGNSGIRMTALGGGLLAVLCLFAGESFLEVWVDAGFAHDAWPPLAALAIGFATLGVGSVGGTLLDAAGRPGLHATITGVGGTLGVGLATAGAAVFETATAAAIGMAIGLMVIGIGQLEYGRRLVLKESAGAVAAAIAVPWGSVLAAGAAAFGVAVLAGASPAVTVVAVVVPTCLVAVPQLRAREAV
jgi:O-antigen/teichoic acid export membrane protein